MNTTNIMTNAILALLPFLSLLAAYLLKLISRKLPENQLQALQQLGTYAVQAIEQLYGNVPGPEKKELATKMILELFADFKLPPPSREAINSIIESTVLLMNNLPQIAQAKESHNPLAQGQDHS